MADLLTAMEVPQYDPNQRSLFIDRSKKSQMEMCINVVKCSRKCVLLHNRNMFGDIPIRQSVYSKEKQEYIEVVLDLVKYEDDKWVICS